ncbi:low molecular weight phosphotyrosine protein phosphatase [Paraburkholderia sp. RL18-103-BIB-C]|uniref:low molecular weight protein-tyrosine-phosphatase n=1 Tax=unclassified Paraburkholderia TaxID=2615204 RepID=UPI0038BDF6E3
MIERVLVVCAGNICRSPMAAALLARRLESVSVESAGITALIGHGADPIAVGLMRDRGLDISSHSGRQLEPWMTTSADLVLVMDTFQKQYLENRFASLYGRVYLLGQVSTPSKHSDAGFNIPDPYRKGYRSFEERLKLIEAGVDEWSSRIKGVSDEPAISTRCADRSSS